MSSRNSQKRREEREAQQLADAQADARRWIERLGGQVMQISGTDSASQQAMADASERFTAANSAISRATTAKQANLARESALEGMHYVNAAREIMGMNPGPELPPLEGQRAAGKVTEKRTVEANGQQITASPYASADTPNYYPGGTVAGRPVPAGWYSRPWWADALQTGVWMVGYSMILMPYSPVCLALAIPRPLLKAATGVAVKAWAMLATWVVTLAMLAAPVTWAAAMTAAACLMALAMVMAADSLTECLISISSRMAVKSGLCAALIPLGGGPFRRFKTDTVHCLRYATQPRQLGGLHTGRGAVW